MGYELGYYTLARPRKLKTWESIALGATAGLAIGASVAAASEYGCYPNLATGLVLSSALSNPFYSGYSFGGYGFTGLLADSLITPTNFGSSLYCDLDMPRGVASVSPMVNAAINAPFSFQGTLGSFMIGGYI